MEVIKLFVNFALVVCLCHASSPSESEVQAYLEQKLTDFQLELQNDFHKQRIDRSTDTGTPFRSEVLNKTGPTDLGFPTPIEDISGYEVVENDEVAFVIGYTVSGKVFVFKTNRTENSPLEEAFSVTNLSGPVVAATSVPVGDDFFLVFAIEIKTGVYRMYVFEYTFFSHHFHHTIDCDGTVLATITLGYASGNLFLIATNYRDLYRSQYDSYMDVYHWRIKHFDPVSTRHKNPIKTTGVFDVVAWEYYGELRFAVLQYSFNKFGQQDGVNELLIFSITSEVHRAFHGSHFEVILDQRIALDVLGSKCAYYFNGVQNLVVTSPEEKNSIFYVFSTLKKSTHFVYNNLQTPYAKGNSIFVLPIPHPFPDDIISIFDNNTKTLQFFNQDIRLRFHENYEFTIESSLVDLNALVLYQTDTFAEVLLLVACDPPISDYAYIITIDIRPLNKTTDVLVECLKDLESLIEERWDNITYLNDRIDNIFVTDKDQNVTSTVIINGVTEVTEELTVHNLWVKTPDMDVPNVTNSILLEEILDAQHQLKKVLHESEKVVFQSGDQTINSSVTFLDDLVAENVKADNISNDVILNGENISRFINNTLKIVGNQTITNTLTLNNLTVENDLEVTSHLNGKDVNDLILTNATQVIVGHYTFNAEVIFENLKVDEINGVQPEYLVLTTGFQVIDGLKTFDVINSSNIEVLTTTNGRDLSHFASKVVTLTENHNITGNWTIEDLYVDGDIDLWGLISNLINITDLAENVVTVDSNQTINGFVIFENKLHVDGSLTAKHVNHIYTDELITLNTVQNITGDIFFKKEVRVTKDLNVSVINKIPITDYVLRKENYNITSHKIFNGSIHVNGDIIMHDLIKIDDVDPSELSSSIAPSTETVEIFGPITIENLIVVNNVEFRELVSNFNITVLNETFWRKSRFQHIPVPVVTSPHVVFKENLTAKHNVNGFDLEDDYVHVFGNETITGHVTFKDDVVVNGDVEFGPDVKINGYDISELAKYAVLKDGPSQEVTGPVYFTTLTVKHGDVYVNTTVNGFNIPEDFLDKGSEQTVFTHLNLTSTSTIVRNVIAHKIIIPPHGTVNDVDISELEKQIVLVNNTRNRTISGKTFENLIVSNLTIDGLINHINFTDFVGRVVTLSTNQTVGGMKTFSGHVSFEGELYLEYLNGIEFTPYAESVINRTQDTVVNGNKTVDGNVWVDGDILIPPHEEVNGIDISKFADRAMVHNKFQNVSGFIWFNTTTVYIENLEIIHANLDGVDLKKVALITENTSLAGFINFTSTVNVNGDLTVKGLVYGCDLYDLYINGIRLHGVSPQIIDGNKIIDELVVVEPGDIVLLPDKETNGVDISELANIVLRQNASQNATGEFRFNTVIVEDLIITNTLNQKNLTELFDDAVFVDENQTIHATKYFNQSVHFWKVLVKNNTVVETAVNEVDLSELFNLTVFKDSNVTIDGKKNFQNNINATDIYIEGLLNGINVTDDLWLVNTSDTLPGTTHFIEEIIIHGDLEVGGLIDGKNLTEIVNERVTLSSNQTITTQLIFNDHVIVQGDCHVSGTINGVDPEDIVKTDGNFTIHDFKTFNATTQVKGNITVEFINGVDIVELSETVVRDDVPAVIWAPTNFHGPVKFDHNLNVNGTVNGINLSVAAEEFYDLRDHINDKLDDLFDRQDNQSDGKHYLSKAVEGQTVVPAHFDKVEWDSFISYELYPQDLNLLSQGNVENPSLLYGLAPGTACPAQCSCSVTCSYQLSGSDVALLNCESKKVLEVCDDTECYKLESPQNAASETCDSGITVGSITIGNSNQFIITPVMTDAALIPSSLGSVIIIAAPTDGITMYKAKAGRIFDSTFQFPTELSDTDGASLAESFIADLNGTDAYAVVTAGNNCITLNIFEDGSPLQFVLTSHILLKYEPTGLLTVKGRNNETFVVLSTAIMNPGFLMQLKAPTLHLYSTSGGKLVLVDEAFTGSIYHISLMEYAGDLYIVTTQTDDDKIILFRLEGPKLVEVDFNIPKANPTATLPSYYYIEDPFTTTNTSVVNNYLINQMLLFVLSPGKISALKTDQFGNGINLETAKP